MIDLAARRRLPAAPDPRDDELRVERGRAPELLALVDARASPTACDITLDTYPYLPGATTLSALLPSWATAGGPTRRWRACGDPDAATRIRDDIEETGSDGCHGVPSTGTPSRSAACANPELDDVRRPHGRRRSPRHRATRPGRASSSTC